MTPQNSLSSSDKVYKEIESQINDMIRAGLSSNEIEREIAMVQNKSSGIKKLNLNH